MAIKITMPDDKVEFSRKDYAKVRDLLKTRSSGVYFLYAVTGELLYVGKTKDFCSRLLAHFRGRDTSADFFRLIYRVVAYFVADDLEREIYETYAINHFQPTYNKAKAYYDDRSDVLFEIDERIRDLEEEKAEIQDGLESGHADGLYDEDFDDDPTLRTGVYFHNIERLKAIETEIKELKRQRTLTL